jgi:hypothetical protein
VVDQPVDDGRDRDRSSKTSAQALNGLLEPTIMLACS